MRKTTRDTAHFHTNDEGQRVDPFTGDLLVPVEQLQEAVQQIPKIVEDANRILQDRIVRGDMRLKDAAEYIGIHSNSLVARLRGIRPREVYLLNGRPPLGKEDEIVVPGSDLIFRHRRNTYLKKELVEAIKTEKEKRIELENINNPDTFLSKIKFARHIGVAAQKNRLFKNLWAEIEQSYGQNSNILPIIGEHPVQCGYIRKGNRINFYVHISEAEWFKNKIGVAEIKTHEWLGKEEVRKELLIGGKHQEFNQLWEEIEHQYASKGGHVVVDGHNLNCDVRRNVSKRAVYINKNELEWVRNKLRLSHIKTEEWLTKCEFADFIGDSRTHDFEQMWKDIAELKAASPTAPIAMRQHEINCGTRKSRKGEVFCLHRDESPWFKRELQRRKEDKQLTSEWRHKNSFARDVGCRTNDISYNKLWEQVKATYQKNPENPVIFSEHTVNCAEKRSGNATIFVVHETEKDWFKKQLGLAEKKTKAWKAKVEIAAILGISPNKNKTFVALWDKIKTAYEQNPDNPKVDDHILKVEHRRVHTQTPICVHIDDMGWIRSQLKMQKTSPTQKIGDADESKLPENVKQKLKEKTSPIRGK